MVAARALVSGAASAARMPGRPARQPSKARPWRLCAMNLDELESAAPPAPAQAKSPRGEVVTDPQQLKAWRDAGALPPRV